MTYYDIFEWKHLILGGFVYIPRRCTNCCGTAQIQPHSGRTSYLHWMRLATAHLQKILRAKSSNLNSIAARALDRAKQYFVPVCCPRSSCFMRRGGRSCPLPLITIEKRKVLENSTKNASPGDLTPAATARVSKDRECL